MDRDTMWEDICSEGMEEKADDIRAGGCNAASCSAKAAANFAALCPPQVELGVSHRFSIATPTRK